MKNKDHHLISHRAEKTSLPTAIREVEARIRQKGARPLATVDEQLEILRQLTEFEFGRFLLQNQGGFNGYWTHYVLTFPEKGRKTNMSSDGKPISELESFYLNKAPIVLAVQQKFRIFLEKNQERVRDQASLASIPCGLLI